MKIIPSAYGFTWHIDLKGKPLSGPDADFIRTFNPTVYHNDLSCELWAFDEKLPSGRWLENIHPDNALRNVRALVL